MKVPHTINANIFKQYEPSNVSLELVADARRKIKSEDVEWDKFLPPKLSELCLMVIVANFEKRIIYHELPCWERNSLLELLPTDLPLELVIKHINDQIYWERKVKSRWQDNANYCQDYGFDWKRMYMERHVQEAVEAMTPEGFDLDAVESLCALSKDYVKNLDIRELQIMQATVVVEDEDEFSVLPEPSDHIDLGPIITGLVNLTELHVQFGLRNVGSDYKKSWFQFSLQDCRNLGAGIAKAEKLRLLRIHGSNLDDERAIALLSCMEPNESLEELDFSNCAVGDDGATAVARFLKNRTKLTTINLCNNRIRENGISALAFMITQSQASPVENLNLKFNSFGDAGARFLASALVREKPQIRKLNISCCDLGEESGILFAEMINRNPIISDLDLSNNYLGEEAGRALKSALNKNRTIEYVDLRMTGISDDDLLDINRALYFNRIRVLKGEKGIERELRVQEKRAENERLRLEQEAIALAKAAAEAEEAARIAALAQSADPDD